MAITANGPPLDADTRLLKSRVRAPHVIFTQPTAVELFYSMAIICTQGMVRHYLLSLEGSQVCTVGATQKDVQ
jgi:hypothetical protein